jgi:hypothetical protein
LAVSVITVAAAITIVRNWPVPLYATLSYRQNDFLLLTAHPGTNPACRD